MGQKGRRTPICAAKWWETKGAHACVLVTWTDNKTRHLKVSEDKRSGQRWRLRSSGTLGNNGRRTVQGEKRIIKVHGGGQDTNGRNPREKTVGVLKEKEGSPGPHQSLRRYRLPPSDYNKNTCKQERRQEGLAGICISFPTPRLTAHLFFCCSSMENSSYTLFSGPIS